MVAWIVRNQDVYDRGCRRAHESFVCREYALPVAADIVFVFSFALKVELVSGKATFTVEVPSGPRESHPLEGCTFGGIFVAEPTFSLSSQLIS
jgi:hypothetical protein